MRGPVEVLGASCPSKGDFYVCEDQFFHFVGCCTINPCETQDGRCPDGDLYPASFDGKSYDLILQQKCIQSEDHDDDPAWYTCKDNDPPFMGCCTSNPCGPDSCPKEDLRMAMLSDTGNNRESFLGGDSDSTTTKTTPATTSTTSTETSSTTATTATSTTANTPTAGADSDSKALSTGAVAGVAVGGSVCGLVILGLLILWFLKRSKTDKSASPPYETYGGRSPGSYGESKLQSPYTPDSAGSHRFHSPHAGPYYQMQPHPASPPYYPGAALPSGFSGSPYSGHVITPPVPLFSDGARMTPELDADGNVGRFAALERDGNMYRQAALSHAAELEGRPSEMEVNGSVKYGNMECRV